MVCEGEEEDEEDGEEVEDHVVAQRGCRGLVGCTPAVLVLGLCWGCAGAVLGLCWGCAGAVLGLCWGCARAVLGLYGGCAGTVLVTDSEARTRPRSGSMAPKTAPLNSSISLSLPPLALETVALVTVPRAAIAAPRSLLGPGVCPQTRPISQAKVAGTTEASVPIYTYIYRLEGSTGTPRYPDKL